VSPSPFLRCTWYIIEHEQTFWHNSLQISFIRYTCV